MRIVFYLLMIFALPCLSSAATLPQEPQVIIILGAPASGKGTQAVQLAKSLNIPHISTGHLLRENISKNTELGKKAKSYMDEGNLVPDDLVLAILFDRISKQDAEQGYILDGFPRTLAQAEALAKKIPPKATVAVLNLVVSDDTIMKRARGRQRSDDTPEVVKKRLETYYAQTAPLIEYYKSKGLLKNIDGEKAPELVFKELQQAIAVPN